MPIIVNQATPGITLFDAVNASAFGQSVTFTATVSNSSGTGATPTGTVTFEDGGTPLFNGTVALNGSGIATYTTSTLAASGSSQTITAVYTDSTGNFSGGTGTLPGGQTVSRTNATIMLTTPTGPDYFGEPVTFTATVSAATPGAGIPTGTVTFLDNGTLLGTAPVPSGNGPATLLTWSLSAGSTHSITAVYGGDTNFTGTTSGVQTEKVNAAAPGYLIWTGGGGGNNTWSNRNNWQGNVTPATGQTLVFTGSASLTNVDNISGLSVASITFLTGGFTITGNALTISSNASGAGYGYGIAGSNTTGTNILNLNVTFSTTAPTIAQAAGGTLILGGNVANGGLPVTVSDTGNVSIGGVISGAGGISATGAGTLVLTGTNTYTGNTTISAGTLQTGNGATGTLGTGTVTDNAALVFNRSNAITVANKIGGNGSLTQAGSGTVILTGTNSYATTTISAGTLQVGSGSTAGTLGTGAVTDNAVLVFNLSGPSTVNDAISGRGNLIQAGSSTLILDWQQHLHRHHHNQQGHAANR